jgi:hypothetical protein
MEGTKCASSTTRTSRQLSGYRPGSWTQPRSKSAYAATIRPSSMGAIGDLMTDKGTYAWFKVADRPSRPSDGLGPYKLMPKVAGIFEISVEDQTRLCTYLGIDSESWDRAGSVVVDCFDWWTTEKYTDARMRRPSWKSFLKSSRCTTHICASSTKSLTTVGCATCTTASVSR